MDPGAPVAPALISLTMVGDSAHADASGAFLDAEDSDEFVDLISLLSEPEPEVAKQPRQPSPVEDQWLEAVDICELIDAAFYADVTDVYTDAKTKTSADKPGTARPSKSVSGWKSANARSSACCVRSPSKHADSATTICGTPIGEGFYCANRLGHLGNCE